MYHEKNIKFYSHLVNFKFSFDRCHGNILNHVILKSKGLKTVYKNNSHRTIGISF